jgi:hypothetical protein
MFLVPVFAVLRMTSFQLKIDKHPKQEGKSLGGGGSENGFSEWRVYELRLRNATLQFPDRF